MNLGEYGNYIRFNASKNLTAYVNTLDLYSPHPHVRRKRKTIEDGLVIGDVNIDVDGVIFLAGEYFQYRFVEGDVDAIGFWRSDFISVDALGEICVKPDVPQYFEVTL